MLLLMLLFRLQQHWHRRRYQQQQQQQQRQNSRPSLRLTYFTTPREEERDKAKFIPNKKRRKIRAARQSVAWLVGERSKQAAAAAMARQASRQATPLKSSQAKHRNTQPALILVGETG